MKFDHPLARNAKVWRFHPQQGEEQDVLVVVTTLELDPENKKYKSDLVDKLKGDAQTFLSDHPKKAAGFLLMNRPKK